MEVRGLLNRDVSAHRRCGPSDTARLVHSSNDALIGAQLGGANRTVMVVGSAYWAEMQ